MNVHIIAPETKKESGGWGRYTHEIVTHLEKNGINIDSKSYDVVHALDIWPYAVKAYLKVIGTKKKLVLSGVGTYSVAPLKVWWKRLILKIIFKRTSKIVCISDYTRDQIKKYIPDTPVETVLMGLTTLPYNAPQKINNFPVILTVGEVKNRKGQLETYKAALSLKEKYPNILYVVIGSQRDKNYVHQITSLGTDHVRLIKDISDEELSSWYNTAHVFCLNSNNDEFGHFEGFGLVILEAGQFGVPSVGSRGCGIESAIQDGINGYLTEQKNIQDIANKIEKALSLNKDTVKQFTHSFDWDKTVKRYIEIYQDEHL